MVFLCPFACTLIYCKLESWTIHRHRKYTWNICLTSNSRNYIIIHIYLSMVYFSQTAKLYTVYTTWHVWTYYLKVRFTRESVRQTFLSVYSSPMWFATSIVRSVHNWLLRFIVENCEIRVVKAELSLGRVEYYRIPTFNRDCKVIEIYVHLTFAN